MSGLSLHVASSLSTEVSLYELAGVLSDFLTRFTETLTVDVGYASLGVTKSQSKIMRIGYHLTTQEECVH